ncbi:unnamed protein product [Gongylonema pulchrum]|uniref:CCHC-type domain-containing protein n=1 Tax=Gongylonema pulchrum TaxID=637853 RepID=A0A183DV43_9BILA|nr:unnamed protein product [Gongylonema pulchrum]
MSSSDSDKCYKCNEKGHIARNCPSQTHDGNRRGASGGLCPFFGQLVKLGSFLSFFKGQ